MAKKKENKTIDFAKLDGLKNVSVITKMLTMLTKLVQGACTSSKKAYQYHDFKVTLQHTE